MVEKGFSTESCDISEVLAPVPSYEEWQAKDSQIDYLQQKVSVLESENQQLKELLLQIHNRQSLIREYLSDCKLGNAWDLFYQTENEIDNAIGEKQPSFKDYITEDQLKQLKGGKK